MKYMNKAYLSFCVLFALSLFTSAQRGTILDEVIAVVGDQIATKSELENKYVAYLKQGATMDDNTKCQIFEDILYSKMLVNQAELDSVVVDEAQIEGELDRRISYYMAQIGSQ